jgi:hypothetical protein
VRDWEVLDADKRTIGQVDGLLVSKDAECVVYLAVAVDASIIKAGHETYAVPAKKGVENIIICHYLLLYSTYSCHRWQFL